MRKGRKWSPELKAKHGPRRGWLTEAQVATLVRILKTSEQTYYEIAADWLIHPHRVSAIARDHGIRRYRTNLSISLTAAQQQALLEAIRHSGKSYAEIAQQFRINYLQAERFGLRHGVRRGRASKKKKLSERDRERMVALCKNTLLSYREIGWRFGITSPTVSRYALAAGFRRGRMGERGAISPWRIAELTQRAKLWPSFRK